MPRWVMNDDTAIKLRRPYKKPFFLKLTPEQARLTLMGHAMMGHQGSMDLLGLMFDDTKTGNNGDEEAA
jgi:hypothetical protein